MNIQAYIESGVIESYVLGMTDSQEAAELEQLSHQYPEIKQAIDEFEASVEKQAFANASMPPASLKEKLLFTLKDEFAKEEDRESIPFTPFQKNPPAYQAPIKTMSSWMKYMAAASVILLVASAGLNIYLYKEAETAKGNYLALLKENTTTTADNRVYQTKMLDMYNSMQLMTDPNMIKVVMPGVKGNEEDLATVFWDSKTKDVYLLANKLPAAADDKQYQLWALVDGKPVDAGMLGDCNGLCKLKSIEKAQAFAITLEKKGGSQVPDLTQLHVLGKVG